MRHRIEKLPDKVFQSVVESGKGLDGLIKIAHALANYAYQAAKQNGGETPKTVSYCFTFDRLEIQVNQQGKVRSKLLGSAQWDEEDAGFSDYDKQLLYAFGIRGD